MRLFYNSITSVDGYIAIRNNKKIGVLFVQSSEYKNYAASLTKYGETSFTERDGSYEKTISDVCYTANKDLALKHDVKNGGEPALLEFLVEYFQAESIIEV